jgi:hypothetical protein
MFEMFMFQVFGVKPYGDPIKAMSLHELSRASILYGLGCFILMS